MYVSKDFLISELPPYVDAWVKVKEHQEVPDIIDLIVQKHYDYASDYDLIAANFIGRNTEETCNNLYDFCKQNIRYKEESEDFQSVGLPSGILKRGFGDCKHYALFIGGCLDSISRITGKKIDWHYCFASYELDKPTPYHVFVVCETESGPMYVDPTPGSADKEPVWVINEKVTAGSGASVNGLGCLVNFSQSTAGCLSGVNPIYGTVVPPPAWYPSYLPLFYWNNNQLNLRPDNTVPSYTENDVLDCLLYLQTIIGYNMPGGNISVACNDKNGKVLARQGVTDAFKQSASGNGAGDFMTAFHAIGTNPATGSQIDPKTYSALQARYIQNEAITKPWLANMQALGGGIDLLTIPSASDIEIARPSWYPNYLPSLFVSAGLQRQYPAGHLDTKAKIRAGYDSAHDYKVLPCDVAALMLYAQNEINKGPTPYPINWYINDIVNGAAANRFKITLAFDKSGGFTDSQEQTYGITGDMMTYPQLDADTSASGFTHTLQTIVSAAVNFFAGKVPGGSTLVQAGTYAANLTGGQIITGGDIPIGVFSAQVFQCADQLHTTIKQQATNKNYLLLLLAALLGLGWYYWDDIKKMKL